MFRSRDFRRSDVARFCPVRASLCRTCRGTDRTAVIYPYVGSFVSCAVGAFIIFMINPVKAVVSIIVFQVVQFIKNQFIYPRVIGGAVGLSALWTLIAVLIGGKLFGIIGMIFFIPLAATAYTLLGQAANKRLEIRKQSNPPQQAAKHQN